MPEKMCQEHKPFECPACHKLCKSLWIHEGYHTDTGDGFLEVKCPHCDYELEPDECDKIGVFDGKGTKYDIGSIKKLDTLADSVADTLHQEAHACLTFRQVVRRIANAFKKADPRFKTAEFIKTCSDR